MNREAALRKLKACLRLSKSSNANEAALAMRQAQKLMQEYNLEEADADDEGISECFAKTRSRGGDVSDHIWQLAYLVARAFSCKALQVNMTNSTAIAFVGRTINTKIAEYSFCVLRRQLERDIAKQIARVRKAKNRATRAHTYGSGWVFGVASKLQIPVMSEVDALRIETRIKNSFGKTVEFENKKPKALNSNDFYEGFQKGKNTSLNKGVHGSQQKQLEHVV